MPSRQSASLATALLTTLAASSPLQPRDCPAGFKNVVFNGGYNPSQFDQLSKAATNWITFGLGTDANRIPMMAFASDVGPAVDMVNSASPPEWMLTFNEPDYAYAGVSPTMSPQEAADAIKPLLASPGTKTKFVAPVTADPNSSWLPDFYAACNCQSFFSAYNIHVYLPTAERIQSGIQSFHDKFADKPIWVTELAPGNADPACSLDWNAVTDIMNQVYSWAAGSGFVDKIFWNTGNEIDGNDHNVCNSYLLDFNNQPTPLLAAYEAVKC